MKKFLLFFVLVMGCSAHVFSENVNGLGFAYEASFERYNSGDVTSYMGSPGITCNFSRSFKEKNFGFCAYVFLGFPQSVYTNKNGIETKTSLKSGIKAGAYTGLVFFFPINEKFIFQPSVGINTITTNITYFENKQSKNADKLITSLNTSLGLGSNISIIYRITKTLALDIGSLFVFDFIKAEARWAENYFFFTARPYISLLHVSS